MNEYANLIGKQCNWIILKILTHDWQLTCDDRVVATLKAKLNRMVNIIVGIFLMVVLVSTLLVPGDLWVFYATYMVFEAVFIILCMDAWKWPTKENSLRM